MKTLFFTLMVLFSANSYATTEGALTFDVSFLKVSIGDARRATLHAINYKNWKIDRITDTEIYFQYNDVKAMADFKSYPEIKLVYTGEDAGSSRWFPAIKKNALVEMVSCMN